MSLAVILNACIAYVEGRDRAAEEILRPLLAADGEQLTPGFDKLRERLEQAVQTRALEGVQKTLRQICQIEVDQILPKDLTKREAQLYLQGKQDVLTLIEEELTTIDDLLQPRETDATINHST